MHGIWNLDARNCTISLSPRPSAGVNPSANFQSFYIVFKGTSDRLKNGFTAIIKVMKIVANSTAVICWDLCMLQFFFNYLKPFNQLLELS